MTVDEIVVAVFVSHLRVWMLLCFLSNELKIDLQIILAVNLGQLPQHSCKFVVEGIRIGKLGGLSGSIYLQSSIHNCARCCTKWWKMSPRSLSADDCRTLKAGVIRSSMRVLSLVLLLSG